MFRWLISLLLVSCVVSADLLTTWDIPTQYVDGETLPLDAITGYFIYVERDGIAQPLIWVEGGSTTSYTIITGRGSYLLQIATKTTDTGPYSAPIYVVDECLSYNTSLYNRRTGINLCGE